MRAPTAMALRQNAMARAGAAMVAVSGAESEIPAMATASRTTSVRTGGAAPGPGAVGGAAGPLRAVLAFLAVRAVVTRPA
ncbi:hypothetical protein GCM10010319_63450 [Streptomyces blastmyceticus]|uniref:Uncharacterized protein n=1 Tax=Streptomyces blastmyceticus TaxID=68180 RepID=A0ABP3HPS0_9ACTN